MTDTAPVFPCPVSVGDIVQAHIIVPPSIYGFMSERIMRGDPSLQDLEWTTKPHLAVVARLASHEDLGWQATLLPVGFSGAQTPIRHCYGLEQVGLRPATMGARRDPTVVGGPQVYCCSFPEPACFTIYDTAVSRHARHWGRG
jgi:hypothetical protein